MVLYLLLHIISSSSKLLIFHRIWTVDRTGPDRILRASVRSGPVQHAPMLGPVRSRSRFLSPSPVRSGPVALGNSVHGPGWTESCPTPAPSVSFYLPVSALMHTIYQLVHYNTLYNCTIIHILAYIIDICPYYICYIIPIGIIIS